jgi:hypothetical protein
MITFKAAATIAKSSINSYTYGYCNQSNNCGYGFSGPIDDSITDIISVLSTGAYASYIQSTSFTKTDGGTVWYVTVTAKYLPTLPLDQYPTCILWQNDLGGVFPTFFSFTNDYGINGGLKQLFIDIKNKILAQVDNNGNQVIKFCQVWNNQVEWEMQGKMYDYIKPACFVEFEAPQQLQQLGTGEQIYDELIVRIHIVHDFFNATDSDSLLEQDLTIFDLKQWVFIALQKFQPNMAATMVRVSESQQYDHNQLYHYIQEYKTNLIDTTMAEPVNGITKQPPTDLQLTVDKNFIIS